MSNDDRKIRKVAKTEGRQTGVESACGMEMESEGEENPLNNGGIAIQNYTPKIQWFNFAFSMRLIFEKKDAQ